MSLDAGAAAAATPAVTMADFVARVRATLTLDLPDGALDLDRVRAGDHRWDNLPPSAVRKPRAAAVLVGVIDRPEGASVLLTRRTAQLRDHSGQIAFPGGKIDPADASPAAAALREAWEEVALDPAAVEPLGYLDAYLTGTGFLIVPTVALIRPPVVLTPNPGEVDAVFEVPLSFLMEAANHQRGTRRFEGRERSFYVIPYLDWRIWGITAGVIRVLYERLYAP